MNRGVVLFSSMLLIVALTACGKEEANREKIEIGGKSVKENQTVAKDGWREFSPPGGPFSVKLPGVPTAQESSPSSDTSQSMYTLIEDPGIYMVGYMDIPEGVDTTGGAPNIIQQLAERFVTGMGGKITSTTPIRAGSQPGAEMLVDLSDMQGASEGSVLHIRSYLIGDKFCLIAIGSDTQNPGVSERATYFDSFKVISAQ